ncbi:hypothetical protein ACFPM7_05140 [Actinokineospora guangxiensis]|uniref:DUF5753 domain-containing protein n=1 Tax=Actinokineospora guangxiensis TaxID=1490288 RepID=A0ABW0EJE9_9PSEU
MTPFGRRARHVDPTPLDARLAAFAGRVGALSDGAGAEGHLLLSRNVVAEHPAMLWWKVRGTPREVLCWDVVIERGPGYIGYLQGEYEEAEALDELLCSAFRLASREYVITWLNGDDAREVREAHFAHLRSPA